MDCRNCGVPITDPLYNRVVFQENYPDIPIGPYCPDCFPLIRVCSGCQVPFDSTESKGLIDYHSNGQWFCKSCKEGGLVVCSSCNLMTHKHVEGTTLCSDCYFKNRFKCNHCHETKSKSEKVSTDSLASYPTILEEYKSICSTCFETLKLTHVHVEIECCKHCSSRYPITEDWTNHTYCPQCYSQFNTCVDCGAHDETVGRVVVDRVDYFLCQKCKDKLKTCFACSEYTRGKHKKKDPIGDTKYLCDRHSHYEFCKSCFKVTLGLDTDGNCHYCTEDLCGTCGKTLTENGTCRACREEGISNYSFKPRPHFNYVGSPYKEIFFGFENEVTFGRIGQALLDTKVNMMYKSFGPDIITLKSDGSISGKGFEIVSQPMTLSFFKKLPLNKMIPEGVKKDKSCGLHIHVSRASFQSQVHLYKVVDFIYNNEELSTLIAGRGQTNYSQHVRSKTSDLLVSKKEYERRKKVNLTNEHTVEFRLFAGCTRTFELSYRIEFVHALISWANYVPLKDSNKESFISFIKKCQSLYRNLYTFLTINKEIN